MKLNISVELDWIEEDGSIDEQVKSELIDGVKRSISHQCLANVQQQASKAIDKAIADSIASAQKAIQDKAVSFANDWLENEVEITDKWGDVKDHTTIKGLIKKSFDDLLEQKVDEKGNFTNADLRYANLTGANLIGANLTNTNLRNCIGDGTFIKSMNIFETYSVSYTHDILQIGCKRHKISDWRGFGEKGILQMDGEKALSFWRKYKDLIFLTISEAPAKEPN